MKNIIITRSQKNKQASLLTLPSDRNTTSMLARKNKKANTLNENKNKTLPNKIDTFLHDDHIRIYFESFQNLTSNIRNDVLFANPSLTQLLKCSSSNYTILSTLTDISFNNINYAFFPVNNHMVSDSDIITANDTKGTHWSLLIFNREQSKFYHCDSLKGLNRTHAEKLAQNINPDFEFVELLTLQQTNSFECGIHVLTNTQLALRTLIQGLDNISSCINPLGKRPTILDTKEDENKLIENHIIIKPTNNSDPHIPSSKVSSFPSITKVHKSVIFNEFVENTSSQLPEVVQKSKNFKYKWINPNKKDNDEKRNTSLIIGDSIIKHIVVPNTDVKVFRGISCAQICNKIDSMKAKKNEHLKQIVLNVGTNDIKSCRTPDYLMGEMYEVVRKVKSVFPSSTILVNSITNRRDVSPLLMKQINSNLRWICHSLKAVFIDLSKTIDSTCLSNDGLHLNRKGSYVLGKNISQVLRICKDQGN